MIEERVVKIQLGRLRSKKRIGSTNFKPIEFSQMVNNMRATEIADIENSDHHVFLANLLLLLNLALATIFVSFCRRSKSFSDM